MGPVCMINRTGQTLLAFAGESLRRERQAIACGWRQGQRLHFVLLSSIPVLSSPSAKAENIFMSKHRLTWDSNPNPSTPYSRAPNYQNTANLHYLRGSSRSQPSLRRAPPVQSHFGDFSSKEKTYITTIEENILIVWQFLVLVFKKTQQQSLSYFQFVQPNRHCSLLILNIINVHNWGLSDVWKAS